jgi:hypothetical protein
MGCGNPTHCQEEKEALQDLVSDFTTVPLDLLRTVMLDQLSPLIYSL